MRIGAVTFIASGHSTPSFPRAVEIVTPARFTVGARDGVFEAAACEVDADADAQATGPSVIFHPASAVDGTVTRPITPRARSFP